MTYPEGREPIKWGDLTPKHSTWEAEAKALRAENERLRAALREIVRMTGKGADAPMTAERWLDRIDETALDALKATTAPQSATQSAKSDHGKATENT